MQRIPLRRPTDAAGRHTPMPVAVNPPGAIKVGVERARRLRPSDVERRKAQA